MLSDPKNRWKVLNTWNHNADFDWQKARELTIRHQAQESIVKFLRSKGAGRNAYVFGDETELDGQTVELSEALDHFAQHDWGIVLSLIPGRLALFHQEQPSEWWLLESPQ